MLYLERSIRKLKRDFDECGHIDGAAVDGGGAELYSIGRLDGIFIEPMPETVKHPRHPDFARTAEDRVQIDFPFELQLPRFLRVGRPRLLQNLDRLIASSR